MEKFVGIMGSLILLSIIVTGCESSVQSKISEVVDIDISSGNEIMNEDTHGGFHGDGLAFAAYQFSDDVVLKQIEENDKWNEIPLSEELIALAYGFTTETSTQKCVRGPYITEANTNKPLLPPIQNGYYYFLNRQTGNNTADEIFGQPSLNYTFLIYDTDTDILYYVKYDS